MKKMAIAAALIAALAFAGIQTASAHGGRNYGNNDYGPGYCGNYFNGNNEYTAEDQAAFDKFRDDTTAIRKEIVVKRSELNALMQNDNPDATKVAKLTGELYDLQTQLESKAEAAGLDNRFANGRGPGMMRGYGGWGRGGYMMGW
jgi:Spy/CpxP family protein refolding chaperone